MLASLAAAPAVLHAQDKLAPVSAELLRRFDSAWAPARAALDQLAAQGEAARFRSPGDPAWLAAEPVRRAIAEAERGMEPSLEVEALFVQSLPDGTHPGLELALHNTLRSVSAMKGVEYWSPSRKRMRVMFNDAAVVDPRDRETRLPDPLVAAAPERETILIFQDDASFGRNLYQAIYSSGDGSLQLSMKNLSTLNYGILPLVSPGELRLTITVIRQPEYLIFHGFIAVKTFSLFGLERNSFESFHQRLKALYRWFSAEFARRLSAG